MPFIYPELPSSIPITTIHDLPAEVLIDIFTYCSHVDTFSPLTLSSVCRYWREVVLGAPAIWRFVVLDSRKHSVEVLQKRALRWLERSEPLAFNLELSVSNKDDILPLLSPLLKYDRRWSSLTLNGPNDDSPVYRYIPPASHDIKKLVILVRGVASVLQIDGGGPLGDLYFNSDCIHVVVDEIPPPCRIRPLQSITLISILERSPEVGTTPATLLRFLTACPVLEQFVFMGWTNNPEHSEEKTPVAFLPHLRNLQIRSTCFARTLLSHIHAPNLAELHLTYLNVDFEVNQVVEDGGGDSDDENGDFSRSPSSDRATGMGLRKLIARSNPPIQLLNMDCSDMRTKDFAFVFDRLIHLEDFSIVASDMSDKVVSLLAPYRMKSGEMGLRLPMLKAIRLYDCIRLSGDVLVEAISERARYQKIGGCGDELSEVTISGCELFLPSHGQVLRSLLPRTLCTFD